MEFCLRGLRGRGGEALLQPHGERWEECKPPRGLRCTRTLPQGHRGLACTYVHPHPSVRSLKLLSGYRISGFVRRGLRALLWFPAPLLDLGPKSSAVTCDPVMVLPVTVWWFSGSPRFLTPKGLR